MGLLIPGDEFIVAANRSGTGQGADEMYHKGLDVVGNIAWMMLTVSLVGKTSVVSPKDAAHSGADTEFIIIVY